MERIIVIVGPTGAGKTAVAAELAHMLKGEIISADSRQVYRWLDVGTGKEGGWDAAGAVRAVKGIPQYLTDLIDPSGLYSAGSFAEAAETCIEGVLAQGKAPIVAGGTGLYVKALIDGLARTPPADPAVRNTLRKELESHGLEHLYARLSRVDPVSAEKNKTNPQRLIRALEVFLSTGTPLTRWHETTRPSTRAFAQFGLAWVRDELCANLDARCSRMLAGGMIEETKRVLEKGFPPGCPGLQGLGYRHVVELLAGRLTLRETEQLFRGDTRRYAKRQMTWFRKDTRITWLPASNSSFDPRALALQIVNTLPNMV